LSNFQETESRVLSAETNLKIAQLNLKSDGELLRNGDISELAYETSLLAVNTAEADYRSALASLSRMEKTYNDTRIMSPISGLVSRKYIDIGMMVTPNVPLYRIVDLSRLKVEVGIAQGIVSHVRLGSKAVVRISGIVDRSFEGSIIYMSPQADENSGTFSAEIQLENTPDMLLKAGMTTKIDLTLTTMGGQLVIPDHALVTKNGTEYIYKVSSNTARLSQIKTGQVFGSLLLVKEGVTEGDTIVVVGMNNLGTETKVWLEMIH
jgi:RND family efflux transporter MFP subunit